MELMTLTDGLTPDRWFFSRIGSLWDDLELPFDRNKMMPVADIVEDANGYCFYFEMPGVKSDSIYVRV